MGHPRAPEAMWHPRSEETYAGPEDARREDRAGRPVAVVGASSDRSKFGNKAVRAYGGDGYTVWPVNPRGGTIEGHEVYTDLRSLPGMPFAVSLYLREDQALAALEELADIQRERGESVAVIYLNPGVDAPAVLRRAEELGLFVSTTCSIRAIGHHPEEYPEDVR